MNQREIQSGKKMSHKITIGHTPDADDAFMFHAMFNGLVDTEGLEFEDHLEPMAELNRKAPEAVYDFTAVSVAWLPAALAQYDLLSAGACMAETRGPVLLVRRGMEPETIAVPGFTTTGCFTARLRHPQAEFRECRFDRILPALDAGEFPAGVLISEDQLRFNPERYEATDLGAWWRDRTGLPLPLGVDLVRRDLPEEIKQRLCRVFRRSIQYAIDHTGAVAAETVRFGRGIWTKPGTAFIRTFVNDYTVEIGSRGRQALECFLQECQANGLIAAMPTLRFIEG